MNIQFHKQALKVFFVILVMEGCIVVLNLQGEETVREIQNNALSHFFGEHNADCLRPDEMVSRYESLDSEEVDRRAIAADEKVRNVYLAMVIIALGLFYLASCMIVRILGVPKPAGR